MAAGVHRAPVFLIAPNSLMGGDVGWNTFMGFFSCGLAVGKPQLFFRS